MVSVRPVEYVAGRTVVVVMSERLCLLLKPCGFFRGEKRGEALPYKTVIVVDPLDFALAHDLFLEQ